MSIYFCHFSVKFEGAVLVNTITHNEVAYLKIRRSQGLRVKPLAFNVGEYSTPRIELVLLIYNVNSVL